MGSANALAAWRLYAGKIPPASMNALAYMAVVALDKDGEPSWWEGHEMLAIRCLGRGEPVGPADLRAVERAITPLFAAGAITTVRHASGRADRRITVRYRLWLVHPAPDEKRRKPKLSTRRKVAEHPTKNGQAPDEKRRTKEEEEKEERDNTGVAVVPPTVEVTGNGEVKTEFDLSTRRGTDAARQAQHDALNEWIRASAGASGSPAPVSADVSANGQAPSVCAADGCTNPVEGKRPGAIYCSKLCKNRETKRRSRAKRRTRAALKATP